MEPGNVNFKSLAEASKKDIEYTTEEYKKICTPEHLADRVLGILESQKGMYGGAKVDLFEHGLQTATRFVRSLHVINTLKHYLKRLMAAIKLSFLHSVAYTAVHPSILFNSH